MSKFEKLLKKIDRAIQDAALADINKARAVFGGEPLKAIPINGADNNLGGSNTPVGLSLKGLLTPKYEDGSGFKEIDGIFCGVWEVPDKALGKRLAEAWGTKYQSMKKRSYCCHRHFEESEMVVVLPQSIIDYESAVVEAADEATRCECCDRMWHGGT